MKILYYASINSQKDSGVLKKIYSQVNEWKKQGNEVILITVSTEKPRRTALAKKELPFIHYDISSRIAALFSGGLFILLNRSLTAFRIRRLIKTHSPDIIYMRECIWFPFVQQVFGSKVPVILEINTLLKRELRHFGFFQRTIYRFFQRNIYTNVAGIVGITDEVIDYYAIYNKPSIAIANGYDFEIAIQPEKGPEKDITRPNLLFIGSPGMVWHGLDHIYEMVELLPEFDFHIVGESGDEFKPLSNLTFHGYLPSSEIADMYSRMDIGIGTMALYRKEMRQACPLKVREYLAYGLPVIIGYYDTDLSGKGLDFVLQIDPRTLNKQNTIDRIQAFVNEWKGKKIPLQAAEKLVSTTGKESIRLGFFSKVLQRSLASTMTLS